MKNLIIALFVVMSTLISFSTSFSQETWSFTDGGYMYADEATEIITKKQINEWKQKKEKIEVNEIKRYLSIRKLYIMPYYDMETVENLLVREYGIRNYLIFNASGTYLMFLVHDEYGYSSFQRSYISEIPTEMLERLVIVCKSNTD